MGRRTVGCVALVSALAGARVEAQSYLSAGVDIDLTTSAIRASIPVDHERPAHFNAEVGRYLDARTGVGLRFETFLAEIHEWGIYTSRAGRLDTSLLGQVRSRLACGSRMCGEVAGGVGVNWERASVTPPHTNHELTMQIAAEFPVLLGPHVSICPSVRYCYIVRDSIPISRSCCTSTGNSLAAGATLLWERGSRRP